MTIDAFDTLDPASSTVIDALDVDRTAEIERKHDQVRELLEQLNLDAILLCLPGNFSWFTSGGESRLEDFHTPSAALYLSKDARLILCDNSNSGQLFDCEVSGMGFQLKERSWQEGYEGLIRDLSQGRKIGSDVAFAKTVDISKQLLPLRLQLSAIEQTRLRELGRIVAHAIEATARSFQPEQTEAQIAGEISHRLVKRGVTPVAIQVMADGQGKRYRNWMYGDNCVKQYCVISATGRQHGLHASATRTASFGLIPEVMKDNFLKANLIQTKGLFFSQPRETIQKVWERVQKTFQQLDVPEEWRQAPQGFLTGYFPREQLLTSTAPGSQIELQSGMAISWSPTIQAAKVGDMMLVDEEGCEIITPATNWPLMEMEVRGQIAKRPNVLLRNAE